MNPIIKSIIHKTKLGKWLLGDWLKVYQAMPNNTGLNSYRRLENKNHMAEQFSSKVKDAEIILLRWLSISFLVFCVSEVFNNVLDVPIILNLIFILLLVLTLLGVCIWGFILYTIVSGELDEQD